MLKRTVFKQNEGLVDRVARVALGIVLLPSGLFLLGGLRGGLPGLVTAGLGVVALITGFTGVSPMYIPFGISTLEKEREVIRKFKSMAAGCQPSGLTRGGQTCCSMHRPSEKTETQQG